MAPISRIRSWPVLAIAVAVMSGTVVTAYGGTAAAAAPPAVGGPVSRPAGRGCPAGMRVWVPRVTAMPAGDPEALAPGNLSRQARIAFGKKAGQILAGHHVHWLGATGCGSSHFRSGPVRDARPPQPARTPGQSTQTSGQSAGKPAQRVTPGAVQSPTWSANWSGFASTDGSFTGASMNWIVPNPTSSVSNGNVSIWPGIGSGNTGTNDELVQAGTQTDSGGSYAWTEVVPLQPSEHPISGFSVSAGDEMAVNVAWDQSTHTASFLLVDYTDDDATMVTQAVSGATSGDEAEWIVERPSECEATCIYSPLMQFATVPVGNGAAEQTINGVTTQNYIGGFEDYGPDNMTDCQGLTAGTNKPSVAIPSSNVDPTGDFDDDWESSGPPGDPVQCTWGISPSQRAISLDLLTDNQAEFLDTTANAEITCPVATASGMTAATGQEEVPLQLATLTKNAFTGCADTRGDNWTATMSSSSFWSFVGDTGSENGVTTGKISGATINVTGTVTTGSDSTASCTFTLTNTVAGNATYTNPLELKITNVPLTVSKVGGSGCATVGIKDKDAVTLSATYVVTSPGSGVTFDP